MPWKTCTTFLEKHANFPFFGLAGFLYFSLILNSGNSLKNQKFSKKFQKFLFFFYFLTFSRKACHFKLAVFWADFWLFSVNSQFWKCIKKSEKFQNFSKFLFFLFFDFFSKSVPFCTCCFFYWFSAIFCYFPDSGN